MKIKFLNKQIGFTLIEILIAVAVVSIMSVVAYGSYRTYEIKSNRDEAQHALVNAMTQYEEYYDRHGSYSIASNDSPPPMLSATLGETESNVSSDVKADYPIDLKDFPSFKPLASFYKFKIYPEKATANAQQLCIAAIPLKNSIQSSDGFLVVDNDGILYHNSKPDSCGEMGLEPEPADDPNVNPTPNNTNTPTCDWSHLANCLSPNPKPTDSPPPTSTPTPTPTSTPTLVPTATPTPLPETCGTERAPGECIQCSTEGSTFPAEDKCADPNSSYVQDQMAKSGISGLDFTITGNDGKVMCNPAIHSWYACSGNCQGIILCGYPAAAGCSGDCSNSVFVNAPCSTYTCAGSTFYVHDYNGPLSCQKVQISCNKGEAGCEYQKCDDKNAGSCSWTISGYKGWFKLIDKCTQPCQVGICGPDKPYSACTTSNKKNLPSYCADAKPYQVCKGDCTGITVVYQDK